MRRIFVDANVFLYAIGEAHPLRDPCRRHISGIAGGEVGGETSFEVLQEVAHFRRRRRGDGTERVREILAWKLPIHSTEKPDLELAFELLDAHPQLAARDALHAATALNRGLDLILSADRHFDVVPGLERIDPTGPSAV